MTYIYDMAGGEEYLGEELLCPKPASDAATPLSPSDHGAARVELQLATVQSRSVDATAAAGLAAFLVDDLIEQIEE